MEGDKCISVKLVEYKNISEIQDDRERIILLFLWKADDLLKILKSGSFDKYFISKHEKVRFLKRKNHEKEKIRNRVSVPAVVFGFRFGALPQLNLSARASWQSDVTKLPFEMPGMNIEWMEQDQYQLVLELKQLVYDGGMVRARREWQKARTAADCQQAEVELYALHQRIDQVYFGILLQNAQHKQMLLLQEQLQKSLEQVQAFLKRGVVCPADVDAVQVELRTVEQSVRSLETSRKAYCEVLSLLTGMDSLRAEALVTPAVTESGSEILRPELQLFARQKNMLLAQKETTRAGIRPTLGLFMQGGYGDPGLNMLKGGFSPYYIAGVQLSWNIGKLYTLKNERRLIDEQMSQVDIRQSTFLLNTRAEAIQARRNIERIRDEIQQRNPFRAGDAAHGARKGTGLSEQGHSRSGTASGPLCLEAHTE